MKGFLSWIWSLTYFKGPATALHSSLEVRPVMQERNNEVKIQTLFCLW